MRRITSPRDSRMAAFRPAETILLGLSMMRSWWFGLPAALDPRPRTVIARAVGEQHLEFGSSRKSLAEYTIQEPVDVIDLISTGNNNRNELWMLHDSCHRILAGTVPVRGKVPANGGLRSTLPARSVRGQPLAGLRAESRNDTARNLPLGPRGISFERLQSHRAPGPGGPAAPLESFRRPLGCSPPPAHTESPRDGAKPG